MIYGFVLLVFFWGFVFKLFPISFKPLILRSKRISSDQIIYQQLLDYDKDLVMPSYKFYDKLIEQLMIYQRKYGVSVQLALRGLRTALIQDVKSDKKIRSIKINSLSQYILMCFFTWFISVHMSLAVDVKPERINLCLILVWQILGAYLFLFLLKFLKKIKFEYFEPVFHSLYSAKSFLLASRPIQEVKAALQHKDLQHANQIQWLRDKTEYLVLAAKKNGKISPCEIDNLIEEVWLTYQLQLENYENLLSGIKVGLFLIFILPSYLFSLAIALGQASS